MDKTDKILCIGDNSSAHQWAHKLTEKLAEENKKIFRGQVYKTDQTLEKGYYYTGLLILNEQKILNVAQNFEKIILLDQNIDQFSHPHIFVSTWKLVNLLRDNHVTIHVINHKNMEFLNYWNTLMDKNKSFCLYPWVKSVTYTNYHTLCTQSSVPVTKESEMKNWQTDKNFTAIRNKMIAGEKLINCESCYRQEKVGKNVSIRRHETLEWAALLKLKSLKELEKIKSPSYFELRFSNKCNIKCRSCDAGFSHLIDRENKQIKDTKFNSLVNKIREQKQLSGIQTIDWKNLKRVYIGGGEPTVQPELYSFLRNCIKNKNTEFELRIGTNAVKISDKLLELFKPFSQVTFSCSIDGTPNIDEYIRWGTLWDQKFQTIKKLQNNGHSIAINFVLSVWNVLALGNILKFFEKEFPGIPAHFNIAGYRGDIISPFNLPYSNEIIHSIKTAKQTSIYLNNEQRTKHLIDSLEKYYTNKPTTNKEKMTKFFYYNDTLDKHRGSRLVDYIPELEEYRKYIK